MTSSSKLTARLAEIDTFDWSEAAKATAKELAIRTAETIESVGYRKWDKPNTQYIDRPTMDISVSYKTQMENSRWSDHQFNPKD